jgi:hypothetical protein
LWEAPTILDLDNRKLDKPTQEGDSTYSQAINPIVDSPTKMTITNKLNDLLTHQIVDVPFTIDLENLTVETTIGGVKLKALIPSV